MSVLLSRRRQDRIMALFPVIALAVFAAITFWLDARVTDSAKSRQKPTLSAPDHFMEDFKIEKTSPKGQVDQVIVGERATHFPDTQSTVIKAPQLSSTIEGKAPLNVRAATAVMMNDSKKKGVEQVDFSGKVVAVQGAFAGREPVTYESETLTLFPQTQRAQTLSSTKTISGDRVMTTQGIEIDAENQTGKTERGFNLELTPKEQKKP
jgi:lipopolysaccharide export system protein LptC